MRKKLIWCTKNKSESNLWERQTLPFCKEWVVELYWSCYNFQFPSCSCLSKLWLSVFELELIKWKDRNDYELKQELGANTYSHHFWTIYTSTLTATICWTKSQNDWLKQESPISISLVYRSCQTRMRRKSFCFFPLKF